MGSLQSVMRCASVVRRKRQRSPPLGLIFPVSIGHGGKPSDPLSCNGHARDLAQLDVSVVEQAFIGS